MRTLVRLSLSLAVAIVVLPAPSAAAEAGCAPIFASKMLASRGVDSSNLKAIAALNGMPEERLKATLPDSTLWIDRCGRLFYVEEKAPATTGAAVSAAPFPYASTFTLHSKPGSSRTIFLDFDGYDITGTAWLSGTDKTSYTLAPYDQDGIPSSFSNAEQDIIQSVWQRIAEDYAPFDVDVTTEQPALSALQRTSSSDLVFGSVLAITSEKDMYPVICPGGCGGIAYIGVYDNSGSTHDYYQPAIVFTQGVSATSAKNIAEAGSHEVGHNVGLSHDGSSSTNYYRGGSGWAPIMGVGYYQPLVQFSKGEYSGANQLQDDYVVMTSNGLPIRADDHANTSASATALTPAASVDGIISTTSDVDYFTYTPSTTGTHTVSVAVAPNSPNLDVSLSVYEGSTLLTTSTPTMTVSTTDVVNGLGASATLTLTAGVQYFFSVDGVGQGDPLTGGYSDYGSRGRYQISLTSPFSVANTSVPAAQVGVSYSTTLTASGGTAPYTWSASGLPAGLSISSSGVISGTPTTAGSFTFTASVQQSTGSSVGRTIPITVNLGATSTSLAASGTSLLPGASLTLTATVTYAGGTSSSGTVTVKDGATTVGTISLSGGQGTLTLNPTSGSHSYTATFTANANWATSTSSAVSVSVAAATATPTVTLSATRAIIAPNTSNTITATVRNDGSLVSGVIVTFFDGGTRLGSAITSTAGTASISVRLSTVAVHPITASTTASATLLSASSDTYNITVATAPSAPSTPSLSAASSTSLTMTWSAPSDGGTAITGYCVYLYSVAKTTKLVTSNCTLSASASTHTFSSLAAGNYAVRVAAINAIGTGTLSSLSTSVRL